MKEKKTTYVALLRGINVGGNNLIKMEDLKKAFSTLGLEKIKTILATGNVLFVSEEKKQEVLEKAIEEKLKKIFGIEIGSFPSIGVFLVGFEYY